MRCGGKGRVLEGGSITRVGMIVREELIEDVIEVRITSWSMLIGMVIGEKLFHVFYVYIFQVGRIDKEEEFWGVLDN